VAVILKALKKEVLERTKLPNFMGLFNNTTPVALFNYRKLHTLDTAVGPTVAQ
jgi:hypothetical protein